MRNEATKLIERAEREGGGRWDNPNSNALSILFGALARELGQNHHREKDDFAAGILIKDRIEKPKKYASKAASRAAMAELLVRGVSPDDLKTLQDKLHGKGDK